jgi:hypothetical protein
MEKEETHLIKGIFNEKSCGLKVVSFDSLAFKGPKLEILGSGISDLHG